MSKDISGISQPFSRLASSGSALRGILLVGAAAALLVACGDKGGPDAAKPTGQVVARLNGEDITALEVNAELQGTQIPPNMPRREAEKQALSNIIERRMLMQAAKDRELNKKPQFQLLQRRTDEQLHVQALASDIAAKVPQPSRQEVDKFIDDNPFLFRERKFFVLDQIQFLRPDNIATLGFQNAKTMGAVEAILSGANIEFRRQPASLDSLGANPEFIREVTRVLEKNPNELFMFANQPQGAPAPVMVVNEVKETRVIPFTGEKARTYASNFIRNQKVQKALAAERDAQRKLAKDKVAFQEGWEPTERKPADAKALAGAAPSGPGTAAAPTPASPELTPAMPAPDSVLPAPAGEPAPAPAG